MSDDPFKGDDFSSDDFTGEDRASIREMKYKASKRWGTLEGLDDLVKGSKRIAVMIAVASAIGGGIAYLIKIGVFQ